MDGGFVALVFVVVVALFVSEMRSLVDQVLRCNTMTTLNSSCTSAYQVLGLWCGVCLDLGDGRKGGPCGPGEERAQSSVCSRD